MTPFTIVDQKIYFPESWNEVTLSQWLQLRKVDITDLPAQIAILSNTARELWFNAKEKDLEFKILPHLKFLETPIDLTRVPVPDSVTIDGMEIKVTKDIGLKTFGQRWSFQNAMSSYLKTGADMTTAIITEFMPDCISIYLCPDEPFTESGAAKFKEKVLQMRVVDAYPISSFFLTNFLLSSNAKQSS